MIDDKELTNYGSSAIEVKKDVAHIRCRTGMYLQDKGTAGLHQTAKEVVDNVLDEYMAGHAKTLVLTLNQKGGWVSMLDDGRGMPIETHKETGKSTLTTIFTIAGAGGKFGKNTYSVSAGLHGVGVTVVNALAEWLVVQTARKGICYEQEYNRGVPKSEPYLLKKGGIHQGTLVKYKPDPEIFGNLQFEPEKLRQTLKEQSYLCKGLALKFVLIDEQGTRTEEDFHSKKGLEDLISTEIKKAGVEAQHDALVFENKWIELALAWTDDQEEHWSTFVNSSPTPEGGTQVTGLKRVITKIIGDLAKGKIYNDDLRAGLFLALHVKISEPQFLGQTKNRLQNTETEADVYNDLYPVFEKWVSENEDIAKAIAERAVSLRYLYDSTKKEKDALKGLVIKGRHARGLLPATKYAEAPTCKPHERELFLVEGMSAGGTAKKARDTYYQEVLALKGKVPNASRSSTTRILSNEEIKNIVTVTNTGVGEQCDVKKSRIGKLMILADADADGQHISALCLSFLTHYMRPMIEAGMVYVVLSPLFKADFKGKTVLGDTLADCMKQLPKNCQPIVTRLKGHGEVDAKWLKQYAMDPNTRKLLQVSFGEDDEAVVLKVMGDDAGFRKVILGIETAEDDVTDGIQA